MSCKNAMQDGRAFTDYTPNCSQNEFIQHGAPYHLNTNTQYRLYLQRHGAELMEWNRARAVTQNATGCRCDFGHPPHHQEYNPKPYNPNDTTTIMKYHQGPVTPFAHAQAPWMY